MSANVLRIVWSLTNTLRLSPFGGGGGGGGGVCVCVCVCVGGGNGILSGSYGSLNNKPNRRCVNALLDTDTKETIERVRVNGVPIL